MNKELVSQVIALIESRPAPDSALVYEFVDKDGQQPPQVTGYSWKWNTDDGYIAIGVRLNLPEIQRQKKDNQITLLVALDQIYISSYNVGGSALGAGGEYEITFREAPRSERPNPVNGLVDILNAALYEPLSI